jgi:hypothetical protein
MNFQDIKTRAQKDFLWDDNTATNDKLNRTINEGLRRFVRETLCLHDVSTLTTAAGTAAYPLPADSLNPPNVHQVIWDKYVLHPMSYLETRDLNSYLHTSGSPTSFYFNNGQLCLYPVPDSAKELKIVYYNKPAELSADDDVPEIPEEFHEALANYAAYQIMRSDRGALAETMNAADFHEHEFTEAIRRCRAAMWHTQNDVLDVIG